MKKFLIIWMAFALPISLLAQKGNIKGFILNDKSGEPMPFSTIILSGTNYNAQTDIDGFFNLPNIPVGEYTLIARFVGFIQDSMPVKVEASKTLNVKLSLKEEGLILKEVSVNAQKQDRKTQVQISTIALS